MSIVLIVCGAVFAVLSLSGLIAPLVSERRRQVRDAVGAPAYFPWLGIVGGLLLIAAGVTLSGWALLVAVAWMVGLAVLSKRSMQQIDDPPPMIARQRDRSLNPLRLLAHPVQSTRELADLFRFKRNAAEQRQWEERRGFRPTSDE